MSRLCFTNGLLPSIQPQVRAQLTIRKHLGEDDPTFSELQQIAHDIKEQQELDDARQDRSKGRVNESVCYVDEEELEDSEEEDVEQILYVREDNKFKPVIKKGSWKGKSLGARSLSQAKTLRLSTSKLLSKVKMRMPSMSITPRRVTAPSRKRSVLKILMLDLTNAGNAG